MISIVNYGLGNVQAIANVYNRLSIPVCLASTPDELERAERVILPGVGAFDWAMSRLDESGLRPALEILVREKGRLLLGICVGMQMLAERSDEGSRPGLSWIPGHVRKFDEAKFSARTGLPHMGWNDVRPKTADSLFRGIETDARFYFLHSYYFEPREESDTLATSDYHGAYASSIRRGNVFGVQFHPEKSHRWGMQLLRNFSEL